MICLKPLQHFIFIALLGILFSAHAERPAGDTVTMKNGDIHHGTVAQEYFKILSPYGSISVPYGGMRLLTIGSGRDRLDRIGTSGFEIFSGKLHAQSLFMLRVLDAPLELDVQDIGEI